MKWFWMLVWLLAGCGEDAQRTVQDPTESRCAVSILFDPTQHGLQSPQTVAVIGSFTAWTAAAIPMQGPDDRGLYGVRVAAPPGVHTYRIWADGQTFLDAFNPLTRYGEGGVEHSALDVPDCTKPALAVTDVVRSPDSRSLQVSLAFLPSQTKAPLDPASITITSEDLPTPTLSHTDQDLTLTWTDLEPGKKYRLRAAVRDTQGQETAPLLVPVWLNETPFDWRDAVIYQVVIDRFRKGDATPLNQDAGISFYQGGDFGGVIAAIEEGYFEALGVNVLWISPPYDNPDGDFIGRDGHPSQAYHGYWPSSPRAVEPRWGGEAGLDALVKTAHSHGIRVLIDTVLNHVHAEHPYFQNTAWLNHPQGDCICGTTCPWHLHIQDCWFDPFLADLNWKHDAVLKALIDDAAWWVERFNLDGLRLDAVPMMPRLAMRHLRAQMQNFETGGEHLFLVGENYTGPSDQAILRYYLGPHTLSGAFDFPVMWTLRAALAGRTSMKTLDAEARAGEAAWDGSGAVMSPFLGNHDVPRFISDVNGDEVWQPRQNPPLQPQAARPYELLRLGWLFVMTQPGAPTIYYGDDIGLAGANDPDNRRGLPQVLSEEQTKTLAALQTLGKARACSEALRRGARETLLVTDRTYAYGRTSTQGYPAVVAINAGETPQTLDLTIPWPLAADASWTEPLGRPVETTQTGVRVTLNPRQGVLLVSDPRCAR